MYRLLLLLSCILTSCVTQENLKGPEIGFGSCLQNGGGERYLWEALEKENLDLFIFAGDNVYADPFNGEQLRVKYDYLSANSGFQKFIKSTKSVAIYDDHDFGLNDSGRENLIKDEAARQCLDFFKVPKDHPRRKHAGVYGDYMIEENGVKVQVILLDTRYFRSSYAFSTEKGKKYAPTDDPKSTVLGDEQWAWLKSALQTQSDFKVIVSSIQIIPDKRGQECWGNFPSERNKLLDLCSSLSEPVIFCSGDAHFAEISKVVFAGKTFYDFTSSALFHPHNTKDGAPTKYSSFPNEYRVKGSAYTAGNFGVLKFFKDKNGRVCQLILKRNNGKQVFTHKVK
ncbi:MAG: alkaline phosphatase family protein [Lentisphaeraceae bacterium]|nr:alkaline phosphatase family protein [Lentisphaeraceae bacterium]